MQKSIKRYICIAAILSTMIGYAQKPEELEVVIVTIRNSNKSEAEKQAEIASITVILNGMYQRARDEAEAAAKAKALADAEAAAKAKAKAEAGGPIPLKEVVVPNNTQMWYFDNDGDGYFGASKQSNTSPGGLWSTSKGAGSDCNDNDATKTNNCTADLPMITWFLDMDGDGYFAAGQMATTSPGAGWVANTTKGPDCNDNLFSADNSVCSVATPTPCTNKTVCSAGYSLVNCECVPDVPPDPCETLKKLNEDSKYKEKLAFVIEKAKTDSTKEYGYSIEKGASDYVAGTNDSMGNLSFPDKDNQMYGIIHDHTLPRPGIGSDGLPTTTIFVQMFSPVDIATFVGILKSTATNGVPIADVFSTLVDNTGNVYTLKYEGTYDDIKEKSVDVYSQTLNKAYDTNFNNRGISKYGGIENAFAAFLEFDVKIPGIVIYKTTPGSAPTKLGITSDGTKISALNTPCK